VASARFPGSGDQLCLWGFSCKRASVDWRKAGGHHPPTSARVHFELPLQTSSPGPFQPGRSLLQTLRSHGCPRLRQPGGGHPQRREFRPCGRCSPNRRGTSSAAPASCCDAVGARGGPALPRLLSCRPWRDGGFFIGPPLLGVTLGCTACWPTAASWQPKWLDAHPCLMAAGLPEGRSNGWGCTANPHKFSDRPRSNHGRRRVLCGATSDGCTAATSQPSEVERLPATCSATLSTVGWTRWFPDAASCPCAALWWYGPSGRCSRWRPRLVLWRFHYACCRLSRHLVVNSATQRLRYATSTAPICHRNCWWVAILSFGEGLAHNHHAHPSAPVTACAGSNSISPGSTSACSNGWGWPGACGWPATG